MKYIVDPRLLLDILEDDPERGGPALALLEKHKNATLVLAPISYVALAPAFMGLRELQDEFLSNLGITVATDFPLETLHTAYKAWSEYVRDNPDKVGGGNELDFVCVGAVALLHDGILTRDGAFFRKYFLSLRVIEP